MKTRHFTAVEWIDFTNRVTSAEQTEAMKKHLESGCKGCAETASIWQKVRKTAAAESSYQPSAADVRIAKASFAAAGGTTPKRQGSAIVQLLFDSFLQPAGVGVRSAGLGVRQMLYKADPYQVDIQIEANKEGTRLTVTGQLLDVTFPGIVGQNVNVTLSNRRGKVLMLMTNEFGEFSGEIENTGDLELTLPGQNNEGVVISLRNALGNVPRTKQ
jgi:hypothetical protein